MRDQIKLKFQQHKPLRLHRYFTGVEVDDHCWNEKTRQWVTPDKNWTSTHANCRSLRAFKRMLRKHSHIRGKAFLWNRYKGYCVEG